MKNIFIWAWMAFILCGLLVQLPAYAAAPVTGYRYQSAYTSGPAGEGPWKLTPELACSSNNTTYNPADGGCFDPPVTGTRYGYVVTEANRICSDGGAPNAALPLADQCGGPAPVVCTAGKVTEYTFAQGVSTGPGTSSAPYIPLGVGGCTVKPFEVVRCFTTGTSPKNAFCTYKVRETGALSGGTGEAVPSAPSESTPKSPDSVPPFSPPTGQGCPAGTVNMGTDSSGGSICGGSGTAPTVPSPPPTTTKPPVTVANPDGSTTVTKVTERLNTDGSKTTVTETTVTASDGTATTTKDTVTGKAGDGVSTGKADATEEQNKDDFCKKHPELNVCQNSSVSGTCAAVACTGDAIQCAIYRQQQKEYCENTAANPISTLGSQVLNGTDPFADPFANPSSVGVGSFSFSDLLGGRSCPANSVIPLPGGGTFSIVFTPICDFAAIMRPILIAAASFGALWLVVGGI